jgi:IclR family acetate operon transcriptional repressor
MEAQRPKSIKPILVLRKARRILDAFSPEAGELTFTQILERSQLPASTCLRLLYSLVEEGFLDKEGDRYRPGVKLVYWASSGLGSTDLTRRAGAVLEALRDVTGETACLYVRQGLVRTCVALAATRHAVVYLPRIGQVMPLHAGSGGKVFLAYSDELRKEVVRDPLPPYADGTAVSVRAIRTELEQIRRQGYAVSFGERDQGAASISAPVVDFGGEVVATLGIVAPIQRLDRETAPGYVGPVVESAHSLSTALGAADDGLAVATLPLND